MKNLGIIGLGNAGANHLKSQVDAGLVNVVAVSDSDSSLLQKVADEFCIERRYTDWHDLVADKEIDAIILATPPFMRREMFLAAAEAGKDILAEKPFGISLQEARDMADAAKRHGIRAMVNFGTRNLPTYKKLRELVQSGEYGTPRWIWFKYFLVVNPKIFNPPGWFWNKKNSGGHLGENAGHAFDLICELMGSVKNVTGITATLPLKHYAESLESGKPDIENLGVATLEHENGGVTVLANGSVPGGEWGMSFDIITDDCVISVKRDKFITIQRDGEEVLNYEAPFAWRPIPSGSLAFARFLNGQSEPDDSIASCEDGVRAMQIAEAAYQSASTRQTASLGNV